MKASISWIKNNCVWKPTHNDLKIIEYDRQDFRNYKLLSMKGNNSRIKSVWRPTFHELEIIVYESKHFRRLNDWVWKSTL